MACSTARWMILEDIFLTVQFLVFLAILTMLLLVFLAFLMFQGFLILLFLVFLMFLIFLTMLFLHDGVRMRKALVMSIHFFWILNILILTPSWSLS